MIIIKDVLAELVSMFVADWRLTVAILVVVAIAAGLIKLAGADPLIGGVVLVVGCLGVMIAAVLLAARGK